VKSLSFPWWRGALASLVLVSGILYVASCATSSSSPAGSPTATKASGTSLKPDPDPRVGLTPGTLVRWAKDTTRMAIAEKAAEASWNLRLVSNSPTPEAFLSRTNSDLAFRGKYAIQGNYDGVLVWDISNPRRPRLTTQYLCPASQSDVSVYKHLLFVSSESSNYGRLDCSPGQSEEPVDHHRIRGIRIFDATDITKPKYIGNVQTCRGSHTHTVVSDPNDKENVYIYISGSSGVRPSEELAGCSNLQPDQDPNSALFRIEVIQIPLAAPQSAKIVTSPRIFEDLDAPPRSIARAQQDSIERANSPGRGGRGGGGGGRGGRGGGGGGDTPIRRGPTQCHDITTYPAVGLAGGACGGYGLLLDIRDVKNPRRIYAAADSNMQFWHSATFSNDGKKVLFTDEWGGGGSPKCRSTDKYEWGSNALFTIENNQLHFKSYYKMPAAQTQLENCVAHNGSLIPIPGREVMVQGWYQGGISVFDWTDVSKPVEIAFYDRGPLNKERMQSAGSWSVYWYNGLIVSSEIARGLDIYELEPSAHISQNEIDAAKTVVFQELNAQEQPKFVWPASFALSRAYLDQLERNNGLAAERIASVRAELTSAEKLKGQARKDALSALATALHSEANSARDQAKAHTLAGSIGDLANATAN
jgi:hypothetical protein